MKTKIEKIALLVLFGCMLSGFLFAKGNSENTKTLTIYGFRGPTGVGMIRLFDNPPQIPGYSVKTEALAQHDLMVARFLSGEAKVGVLPPDVAAKLASSGKDIRVAAIIGMGMLSLLSSDPAVRSLDDLKDRTVQAPAQGAVPDYVFRRILEARGLKPDRDVKLDFSLAYPEIAQSLIAGRISIGLMPEPFATMARLGRQDLHSVADVQEEWIRIAGGENFPLTVIVVDGAFADANPQAVAAILGAVKDSIEWVQEHPAEAGALVEKHDLGMRAAVVAAAVPNCGYVFIPAAEGRSSLEALYRAFLEYNPVSIGGALPSDGFYLK